MKRSSVAKLAALGCLLTPTSALARAPAATPVVAPVLSASEAAEDVSPSDLTAALNEQVVFGASRTTESIESAPVTASTIRAEDLRRHGMRTLDEALRFLGLGVFTSNGNFALSTSTGARGVVQTGDQNNHFLFVLDGSVVNDEVGVPLGWALGVPLEMIDTVEVILGPGSVLYGGAAMLGVINIRTKPARQMKGVRFFAEYGVSPSQNQEGRVKSWDPNGVGSSPRLSASLGHSFSFLGADSELTGQLEWAEASFPRNDFGPRPPGTPEPSDASATGPYHLRGPQDGTAGGYARLRVGKVTLDAQYNRWLIPQTNRPVSVEEAVLVGNRGRVDATYAFALSSRLSGFVRSYLLAANTTLAGYGAADKCPLGATPGGYCLTNFENFSNHQGTEIQGTYDFAGDGRYQLMAGFDGRLRQSGQVNSKQDAATIKSFPVDGVFEAQGVTLSGYGQLRAQPWNWFSANAGLRADWIHTAASGLPGAATTNPVVLTKLPDHETGALSPRLGLVFFPTSTTTVHASVGRAFRAPSPSSYYTVAPGLAAAGELSPETVTSGELGLKRKYGAHRALLTGFVARWESLISVGLSSTVANSAQFINSGSIDNYGINAAVEGSFFLSRLQYGATFTWGYARTQQPQPDLSGLPAAAAQLITAASQTAVSRTELVAAPEVMGNARIAYDLQNELPVLALAASVYGPRLTTFGYSNILNVGSPAAPISLPGFGYRWNSNTDPKFTDPRVELRLTVSGPVPSIPAVRYRLMGNYMFTPAFDAESYSAPNANGVPTVADVSGIPGVISYPRTYGTLYPATVATIMAGLEFDIDG